MASILGQARGQLQICNQCSIHVTQRGTQVLWAVLSPSPNSGLMDLLYFSNLQFSPGKRRVRGGTVWCGNMSTHQIKSTSSNITCHVDNRPPNFSERQFKNLVFGRSRVCPPRDASECHPGKEHVAFLQISPILQGSSPSMPRSNFASAIPL